MAELKAIRCTSCGGAVAWAPGREGPACVFCGRATLVEAPDERIVPPQEVLPFRIDAAEARSSARKHARSRFWAPESFRSARAELAPVLVPAWAFSGTVEAHWAAAVRAATRSGKRPRTGRDEVALEGVLVLASGALTPEELDGLGPFDREGARPFEPDALQVPFEVGGLTVAAAREAGRARLLEAARAAIARSIPDVRLAVSAVFHDVEGVPLLLPVYVGVWRDGQRTHRLVVNGQTGAVTGDVPVSWAKVSAAVLAALAVLALLAAVLSGAAR